MKFRGSIFKIKIVYKPKDDFTIHDKVYVYDKVGIFFSGEGGIRTLGSPKGYNGFRDRPNRPLWHLSEGQAWIILEINNGVKLALQLE